MSEDKRQQIRERAHQIWEQAGRPDGKEVDHWHQAEREIDDGDEDMDAERGMGKGQSDTELTQTDQAEATAANAASEVNEGTAAEGVTERLSRGDELSQKPPGSRATRK
jgi:hypothetical protein